MLMSHVHAMFLLVQKPQVERFSKHPTCKGQMVPRFGTAHGPVDWRKWMNNIWKIWGNQLLFKACFVGSFCFILWCSTFKCTSSKTLDSRLSTGLPGRKRGFSLHLCPDWMLVGSWFEVFKCYSCSWQAETWSGSSVLLSNFSLSTTIWEKLVTMASSTTMGSMTFMTVMTPAQSMDMRYWVKKFYKDASDWNDSISRLAGR